MNEKSFFLYTLIDHHHLLEQKKNEDYISSQ